MMVLASLPCFQTLIDTKRSETIAEATEPPSSADEVSRRRGDGRGGGGGGGGDSRQSTLSRHASMDNLQRSSPTRAGQYARHGQHHPQPSPKYTSMMNLNTSHGHEHESLKTLKRSKKREAPAPVGPPVAAKPPIAAGMSTAARQRAAAKTAPTPNQPQARDASLQFLGRMSPEEQLNKFLKSVEEVNAENLGRLRRRKDKDARASSLTDNSSSSGAEAALKRMTGPVLHSRARAMRRESSRRDSRWHSMDNLSNMKQTLKQQLQQQHLLHTPARSRKPPALHSTTSSNSSRDKASQPQPPQGVDGTPAKPSRRKRQESPKAVGFREVNGPSKAFSSMSQLDNLRGTHDSVRFSDPISSSSATSTGVVTKSKRNSRGSPMETTSSSSHSRTASSTEMDANGNRKSAKNQRVTEISPPPPMPPAQPMPTSSAIVSYLGSIALNSQASDLTSLQLPLKELYYKYMSNEIPPLSNSRLDITDTGLRVLYRQGPSGRQAEIFNPFPSIAVWAAVRFVYKRASTNEPGKFLFAFLPLISDPGDTEKDQLYTALSKKDVKLAVSNEHPAMFACIMRRMGSSRKQLECHGFVCDSKEDAIMIAANLYRSLMETMKRQQELEEEGATTSATSATFWSDTTPSRPPRKKRSKKSSSKNNSRSQSMDDATSQMDTAVDEDLQTNTMRKKKSLGRSHSAKVSDHGDSYKRRVKRSASERRSVADEEEDQEELSEDETGTVRRRKKGDIYTKVAMPRSKSFMNVSGPYNLQELFKELKDKEGIESVDDILRQVISKEGMSFNRTSPMYRELLMKLAMSLSADEMFIRSKNIMMQEKSKSVNREESSAFGRVFGGIFGRNKNKNSVPNLAGPKVSKADIGGPLPVSEEARRELTKQWMKVTPQLAELSTAQQHLKSAQSAKSVLSAATATSSGSSGNNNKGKVASAANSNSNNNRNKPRSRSREERAASCSECGGYQSTSQFSYSVCSCSLTTTAVDTMINSDEDDGESTAPSSASAMK